MGLVYLWCFSLKQWEGPSVHWGTGYMAFGSDVRFMLRVSVYGHDNEIANMADLFVL